MGQVEMDPIVLILTGLVAGAGDPAELAGLPADAERFDAKASVLIETVTHHIEEEERDRFPKVRSGLGGKQLPGDRGPAGGGAAAGTHHSRATQRAEENNRGCYLLSDGARKSRLVRSRPAPGAMQV
jgi:hypothetical protein